MDWLEELPPFSLHMLRHSLTSFAGNDEVLPVAGVSAVLAHRVDGDEKAAKASPTTGRFYDVGMKLELKARIIEPWVATILEAYVKAGGVEFADYLSPLSDTSGDA